MSCYIAAGNAIGEQSEEISLRAREAAGREVREGERREAKILLPSGMFPKILYERWAGERKTERERKR